MRPKNSIFLGLLCFCLLVACGSHENPRPNRAQVKVPASANVAKYVSFSFIPTVISGRVTFVSMTVRPSPGSSKSVTVQGNPMLAARVATTFHSRAIDETATARLAQQVLRATYCRSGAITLAAGGRRFTSAEDLAAIIAASTAANRDVVPDHVKGTKIPAVSFDPHRSATILLSMRCDAPDPYPPR